jgi:hypothetical protein
MFVKSDLRGGNMQGDPYRYLRSGSASLFDVGRKVETESKNASVAVGFHVDCTKQQ